MNDAAAAGSGEQFLTFLLAGEEYGVDILRVQEIKGWDKATRIPNAPDYVLGVINLRGTVVPVIDLRKRFSLEHVAFGAQTVVIVVNVRSARGERTVGMVVDGVSEVYQVPPEALKPPPETSMSVETRFVKGLAMLDQKMIIALDIDVLLADGIDSAAAAA